jgi:hypothetical protein
MVFKKNSPHYENSLLLFSVITLVGTHPLGILEKKKQYQAL